MGEFNPDPFGMHAITERPRKSAVQRFIALAIWVAARWAAFVLLCVSSAVAGVLLFKIFGSP